MVIPYAMQSQRCYVKRRVQFTCMYTCGALELVVSSDDDPSHSRACTLPKLCLLAPVFIDSAEPCSGFSVVHYGHSFSTRFASCSII